jgi:hypothetical protein
MTNNLVQSAIKGASIQARPGYLLAPFGWAAERLLAMVGSQRALAAEVLQLDRARMHLIALAFAHCECQTGDCLMPGLCAELLLRRSLTEVLDVVLQRRPPGLKRALEHMPVQVLPPESYRHLVESLEDKATTKLIHHAPCIDEDFIATFHSVPRPLRRIVALTAANHWVELRGFTEGLRLLASRGVAPSFEALVEDLSSISQPSQLIARINNLVSALPLPECIPPVNVGGARRIDEPGEICRLAKRWKNCLKNYVQPTNDGAAAVYLWPDRSAPAVCLLLRFGRIGWALVDIKGPKNADLPPARIKEIENAFGEIGLVRSSGVRALEQIAESQDHSRVRQYLRQEAEVGDMFGEFEEADQ